MPYHLFKCRVGEVGLATEGKFTGESAVSLEAATAVLMIYGSEEVICRSLAFADQIEIEPDSISADYFDIVLKMREELTGETKIMGVGISKEQCTYSLL